MFIFVDLKLACNIHFDLYVSIIFKVFSVIFSVEMAGFFFYFCRSEPKKTKVKKRTLNPQFEESFLFEVCNYH